jgi:hypothetical protein
MKRIFKHLDLPTGEERAGKVFLFSGGGGNFICISTGAQNDFNPYGEKLWVSIYLDSLPEEVR